MPTLGDLFTPPSQNFAFLAGSVRRPVHRQRHRQPRRQLRGGRAFRSASSTPLARTPDDRLLLAGQSLPRGRDRQEPHDRRGDHAALDPGPQRHGRLLPRSGVDNLIAVLGAQTILNQCYDLPDLEQPVLRPALPAQPGLHLRKPGVDLGAASTSRSSRRTASTSRSTYRRTFDNGHRLNVRGIATYVHQARTTSSARPIPTSATGISASSATRNGPRTSTSATASARSICATR